MAIGVSLWFDRALEDRVRGLWRGVAERGWSRRLHEGPYRPHVTLGVWERLDLPRLVPALRGALASAGSFPIAFGSVGTFPGGEGVAFLAPCMSARLFELHRQVHALGTEHGTGAFAYYVPDAWIPHCTIAWNATPEAVLDSVAWLAALDLPWEGRAEAVGVIDTPAEIELFRVPIGPASP